MKYFKNGRSAGDWRIKVESVQEILMNGGKTLAQGALAWGYAIGEVAIPIPGIRAVKQAGENCGALQLDPLRASDVTEIDSILGYQ